MKPNEGHLPLEATGKRVIVLLANGELCGTEPISAVSPAGWAAATTRWSLTGHPFDVAEFEVIR